MDYSSDHPKNINSFACEAVLVRPGSLQNTGKKPDILLKLGIWFKTTWFSSIKLTPYVLCISRLPKNLHWQGFSNAKPICVCALDVVAYFGCNNAVIICPSSSGTSPRLFEL